MEYIDIDNWKRKEHFNFFYRMDYPQYNVCMNIDITNFLRFTKEHNLSFYYAMIYAVMDIANQSENFRYRIRDGKVVLHDCLHPSFTDNSIEPDDDLFKFVTVDMCGDLFEFVEKTKEISKHQADYFPMEKIIGRDDFIFITCVPWISFTHLSHTITVNRNDSVPKISWGKYFTEGDKVLLPFSVQVHHALADGFHVGKYVNDLQKYLDSVK